MQPDAVDLMCREVVELVSDYLAETLAAEARARVDAHLLTCPPCTAYLAQLRTTVALAGELAHPDAGGVADAAGAAAQADELVSLFRRWHER